MAFKNFVRLKYWPINPHHMVKDSPRFEKKIKAIQRKLPHFPDGRIDYSQADTALVLTIFIKYNDEILLLKRSDKVAHYRGKWNTVTGYLDEDKPIKDKALEELSEEIGLTNDYIESMVTGETYEFVDKVVKKTWIVHPVLVKVKEKMEVTINWEHTEYKWIKYTELQTYDIVPNIDKTLRRVLK